MFYHLLFTEERNKNTDNYFFFFKLFLINGILHQLVSPPRTKISTAEETTLSEKNSITENGSAAGGSVAQETLDPTALIVVVVDETSGKVAAPTNIDELFKHNSGTLCAEESSGLKNLGQGERGAAAATDEKDTVTKENMAAVKNNSSNSDVRNMCTFTKMNCQLSSLSSRSIILMVFFSMVTVCNSSSCVGCEDLPGTKSGIAWNDGSDDCDAYAANDYCLDYGAGDYEEGAANDKW